jgi:hypothetical protein
MPPFAWFILGWVCGGAFMWGYFLWVGLIRSRSEFYRHRKIKGYSVPNNWEEDDP